MFERGELKEFRDSFKLIAILIISALHLIFIVVFDKVTAFAPDEANYIGVFNNLYRSDFSLDGYLGWQEGSINALRLIYLPGKLLEIIGFSDFYAVRILSVFYSMLSLYLLLKLAPEERINRIQIRFWVAVAYLFPSVFLWTSIGLRESFIFFSFVAIFYILVNPNRLSFRRQFLLLAGASTLFLISKIYLFSLLFICLVSSTLFLSISRKKLELRIFKLLSAFLVPLLIFPSIATSIATVAKGTLEVKLIAPTPTPTPTPTATPTPTPTPTPTVPARGQTLHDLNQQFDKNPILSWLSQVTGIQSILDERAEASYLPAGSTELTENTTQLQIQPASLRDPFSLLVGAYNFLFVPTPFVDNGSFFLNAQSYESFAWYFYYVILVLLLIGLIRRRYVLNLVTLSTTLFSLGFIAMSALTEINDGTSVRHRAVLLIAILVMLATFQRKQPERLED
jgi:hypothetical protein